MLKYILSLFLLITPAVADECKTQENVRTAVNQQAPGGTEYFFTDEKATRVNEALEATVNTRNPYEYDSVSVFVLSYQGQRALYIVYYKNGCGSAQMLLGDPRAQEFIRNLSDRGISF